MRRVRGLYMTQLRVSDRGIHVRKLCNLYTYVKCPGLQESDVRQVRSYTTKVFKVSLSMFRIVIIKQTNSKMDISCCFRNTWIFSISNIYCSLHFDTLTSSYSSTRYIKVYGCITLEVVSIFLQSFTNLVPRPVNVNMTVENDQSRLKVIYASESGKYKVGWSGKSVLRT